MEFKISVKGIVDPSSADSFALWTYDRSFGKRQMILFPFRKESVCLSYVQKKQLAAIANATD